MKRKMRLRWWGMGLGLLGLGVVLVAHMSYGEATILRQFRINWWSGNVSVIWGLRSGASGDILSLDETLWSGWFHSWIRPSFSMGPGGGRLVFHTAYISIGVGLALMLQLALSVVRFRRRAGSCSECGYSLEGLKSDVCPECGEQYA